MFIAKCKECGGDVAWVWYDGPVVHIDCYDPEKEQEYQEDEITDAHN